jgi:AcrR family transcriptional regulator
MEKEYTLSLRERKHAQTKIALAEAVMERLKTKRLKDISVKEVCETIPVSEVTFYNYFPRKTDVLVYILKLWHLNMGWHLKQWETEKSNIEIIEAFFDFAAREIGQYPWVMNDTLAFFLQKRGDVCFEDISVAEKLLAFPELKGIEEISLPRNPKEKPMLDKYIDRAIAKGELSEETDSELVKACIDAIFIGAVMSLHEKNPRQIRIVSRKILQMFWQGLWAEAPQVSESSESSDVLHEQLFQIPHLAGGISS